MNRNDLKAFTPEQAAEAKVVVQRVEHWRRWRVIVNDDIVKDIGGYDCLYADIERISGWLKEAGIETFTVRMHDSN